MRQQAYKSIRELIADLPPDQQERLKPLFDQIESEIELHWEDRPFFFCPGCGSNQIQIASVERREELSWLNIECFSNRTCSFVSGSFYHPFRPFSWWDTHPQWHKNTQYGQL